MNIKSDSQSKDCQSINNAESACQHCEGTFEHAVWCVTREPRMTYVFLIVRDASKITEGDALILHSLGVTWMDSMRDLASNLKV